MPNVKEKEHPMFEFSTLRMIVGAFAFGLPWLVYILVGRFTTSISWSYHELMTRDIFVGSLFVIGALLISYKGHLQGEPFEEGLGLWDRFWSFKWIYRYQENLISTIGGLAAVTAALFPTAKDPQHMDTAAYIHTVSAFLLFANVAYFSIIAFLRSLNKKLLTYDVFEKNDEFQQTMTDIRTSKTRRALNPLRFIWNLLTFEMQIFLAIASEKLEQYKGSNTDMPLLRLLWLYGKKFTRGFVYVIFGSLTVLVLLISIILAALVALNVISNSSLPAETTFVIETLAMLFFGITWMTAGQVEYGRPFEWLLERFLQKQPAVAQPGTP